MNFRLHSVLVAGALAVAGLATTASGTQQSPLVSAPAPTAIVRTAAEPAVASISWLRSFEAARGSARADQLIVVDVSTDWCAWCRYMETQVYPNPVVGQFASGNLFVRVNARDGGEGQAFAKRQKVKAYPTILVFSSSGKLIQKQVGAFDTGERFVGWLRGATGRR